MPAVARPCEGGGGHDRHEGVPRQLESREPYRQASTALESITIAG